MPQTTAAADGSLVVTSHEDDGPSQTIVGRRFSSAAESLGAEFQVSQQGSAQHHATSSAADGSFFVPRSVIDATEFGVEPNFTRARRFAFATTADGDGDGVADNCDVCPGFDDTADEDGDLIHDDCDPCFGIGPNDTDGDGFCDEIVLFNGPESGDTSACRPS